MIFSNPDGQISNQAPTVSILDHGFLFGDSLYEAVRLYDRKLFAWPEHRDRLLRGAERIGLDIRGQIPLVEKRMKELFTALAEPNAGARIIVTRGVGKLHIDWRTCERPNILMAAWKLNLGDQPKQLRLWVSKIRRNSALALDPSIKSGNYLNNVLALKDAVENQFDDAVLLNPEGDVTELTTSNIAWVKDGRICTPQMEAGILHGVTRKTLLEVVDIEQKKFTLPDLLSADEVFGLATFKEVIPVTEIGQASGERKTFPIGPVTLELQKKLKAGIEKKLSREEPLF